MVFINSLNDKVLTAKYPLKENISKNQIPDLDLAIAN